MTATLAENVEPATASNTWDDIVLDAVGFAPPPYGYVVGLTDLGTHVSSIFEPRGMESIEIELPVHYSQAEYFFWTSGNEFLDEPTVTVEAYDVFHRSAGVIDSPFKIEWNNGEFED